MRVIILLIFITFGLSGCGTNSPYNSDSGIKAENNPSDRLVSIQQNTSIPCLENCTSIHVGYARAQYDNLFRTVRHVLPANIDQILIQGKGVCGIKQIWNHHTQDLSLIETVGTCMPGIGSGFIASGTHDQGTLLKNSTKLSVSITENEGLLFASGLLLEPGMSGSPLISSQGTLIGLVHAQTVLGTSFIDIAKWGNEFYQLTK